MTRRTFLAAGAASAAAPAPSAQFTKSICGVIFPNSMPLDDRMRQAKQAGFDGIELRLGDQIDLDWTPEQCKRLAGVAREAGVAIVSLWGAAWWFGRESTIFRS